MKKLAIPIVLLALILLVPVLVACGGSEGKTVLQNMEQGDWLVGQGQYEEGIEEYTKAIELDNTFSMAYYNRGIAYADMDKYDLAIFDYTKAIELDPNYAEAYNNRGIVYGKLGQDDLAIADFSKAIELDPDDALAYNNRGVAYGSQEQYESSIADFTKAIELNPYYTNAYRSRGNFYEKQGRKVEAIADYETFIALSDNPAEIEMVQDWIEGAQNNIKELSAVCEGDFTTFSKYGFSFDYPSVPFG